jgi:hypothetical protein
MAAIGAATIAGTFLYAPWSQDGPVLCPFRLFTGLPCPGCGLTRSFCAIAQGDLRDAVAFHVLGPALFTALVLGILPLLVQGFTRRPVRLVNSMLFSMRTSYLAAGLLAAFHIVRLAAMACSGSLWAGIGSSLIAVMLRHVWG